MQAQFFDTPQTSGGFGSLPQAQAPQIVEGGSQQPWMTGVGSPRSEIKKKRRTEKDFPGIPKGYWWKPEEAEDAKRKGEYIKINGGLRKDKPSKPQKFSFEATVLKGAPFKRRKNKQTGQYEENAYSGQGLHIVFLDTITIGGKNILARMSGDPIDIAYALVLGVPIKPTMTGDQGNVEVNFSQLSPVDARNFINAQILPFVIAQSYNYFTIVEAQGKGTPTVKAMDDWDRSKNRRFYEDTTLYNWLRNESNNSKLRSIIPADLFQRFVEEATARVDDKDSQRKALEEFQQEVLLYNFLSHHIRGPDCKKYGPDNQEVEPYTLPGARRKQTLFSLLQEVYSDSNHVIDISPLVNGKPVRKAKKPKLTKDKKTRAKGVPVNFSLNIAGTKYDFVDKVYSNNEGSVEHALKELGFDATTISNQKLAVRAALAQKQADKLSKKQKVQSVLEFEAKGQSCQVTRYSNVGQSYGLPPGVQRMGNVGATVSSWLPEEPGQQLGEGGEGEGGEEF